jgi:hypothetical protein
LVNETSDMALGDYQRRGDAELRETKEQLWCQQQENEALREKVEGLRRTVEERRADVTGFKVCGMHGREGRWGWRRGCGKV